MDGIIAGIERLYRLVAATCLAAIMLIVAADVLLRYLFNAPLSWAFDLISLYLMAGVFFLSRMPASNTTETLFGLAAYPSRLSRGCAGG